MAYTTLIRPSELMPNIDNPAWAVVDCRFSLGRPERGRQGYLAGHIPGAVYAHLEEDLSARVIPGKTGRHPLPTVDSFGKTLENWGIDSDTQVVTYDDAGGAMAARLWWMLSWVGHEKAALLDGGLQAWSALGFPVRSGPERRLQKRFEAHPQGHLLVDSRRVEEMIRDPRFLIMDARAEARYRGEVEPIDPVAGHIPGAISVPYAGNLNSEGAFLSRDALRRRFENLIKPVPVENVVCYCGSGVTAAHDILALAQAGLGMGRLYVGSWSEWITDPSRPIAKG